MNKFTPKRRFRQRDLLPKSIALIYANRDYSFAEVCLKLEQASPWVTVLRLIDESVLLDIREQATKVLLDSNLPAARWGEVPPVALSNEWRDADERCEGK